MSVVLYALGVALLAWGGYVLLSGDMIATLDIAASLVGYGAFAIGLGAVAGAIKRLTRVVADHGALRETSPSIPDPRELPPLHALRRAAPPPVETPEPPASDMRVEPAVPHAERAPAAKVAMPEAPPEPAPELPPPPPAPVRPRIEAAPERPAPTLEDPRPSRTERRRRRELEAAVDEAAAGPPPAASVSAPGGPQPAEAVVAPAAVAAVPEAPPAVPEPRVEEAPKVEAPVVAPPVAIQEPASPAAVSAPEPKVPEWLARARARREARARAEAQDAAFEPAVADVAPVAEDAEAAPADEPAPVERVVLREGEHNGVQYRFFADGSVEAESAHGMRRFGSLEELRATVLAVRGHIEDDDDPHAPPEAELMVAPPAVEPEPSPPTPGGRPDDDFEAALAALEGHGDAPGRYEPPSLGDIRPGRDR